jgi:nucleoside-diphosphate-sugar epimerase
MGTVLVTGATGFLGNRLTERLAAEGLSVLAQGRDSVKCDALEEAGHLVVRADLSSSLRPETHPGLCDLEAVIHCAALSAPFGRLADFRRANVVATQNLVALAQQLGVRRFVQISSPSIYFTCADRFNVREDDPLPPPFTAYARTKREAEEVVLGARDVGPVVLRPRGLYGAGDTALLPRLIEAAGRHPLPLFRGGAARIDLTHIDDAVSAVTHALRAPVDAEGQSFNISGGEPLPVKRIAEEACARAGIAAKWKPVPLRPALTVAGIMEGICLALPGTPEPPITRYGLGLFAYAQSLDISKARKKLGWRPEIPFDRGLERTFRERGGA